MRKLFTVFLVFVSHFSFSQAPNWEWAKSGGANGSDLVTSNATDNVGNVIVGGSFNSDTLILGSDTLYNDTTGNYKDVFIAKYDSTGNILWARSGGGSSADDLSSIATDYAGNILVAGRFNSSVFFLDTINLVNSDSIHEDIYLAKYDPNGNLLWAKRIGGNGYEGTPYVAADLNGNILLAGAFQSSAISFGSIILNNVGGYDVFLTKYDQSGNALWARRAGGLINEASSYVTTDVNGNILWLGNFTGASMTFGSTTLISASPSDYEIFLAKYSTTGNVIWAKNPSGNSGDLGYGLASNTAGDIYMAGAYYSYSISFDTITLANLSSASSNNEIFIAKYNSSGNAIWAKTAGGIYSDVAYSIALDQMGEIYITGGFGSPSIAFDSITISNTGSYDAFFAKYNAAGSLLWAKTSEGLGSDWGTSVSTDLNGNIYFGGYFPGSYIIFDNDTIISLGQTDFFLAKLNGIPSGISSFLRSDAKTLIYPNPSNGIFQFSGSDSPIHSVEVFNVLGEIIFTSQNIDANSQIDLSVQPNGIYFVKMQMENNSFTQRIIISH